MDSVEFTEWLQYWELTAELSGLVKRDPSPDELGGRIRAFADIQNARVAALAAKDR